MILDIDKSMPPAGPVFVRVGEIGARVSAEIVDQGEPIDMTGMAVTFRVLWDGGSASAPCTVSGSEAAWSMPEIPACRVLSAYVELSFGEALITTSEIEIHMEEAA